jgi:peptidoglycan glycosyltransferase
MIQAENWVAFEGSPHIYIGGNMRCGVVTDRDGEVLLSDLDERTYSDDLRIRQSTIHWVGDRVGYISAPAASYYAEKIIGYNRISGLYSYAGTGGKAEMTLSADLQKIALDALGELKGTVAVYNYLTGEILCAVTTPNYDPDNVPDIAGNEEGIYEGIYLNRFTQVSYVPGSIFKLVTTAAALEKLGPEAAELNFNCTGTYALGADQVTCAKSHGNMTMKTALAKSCNCYYAQLIMLMGGEVLELMRERAERLEREAKQQGFEQGLEQGIEQGIERGIEQEKIHTVVTLIEKLNLPFDEVIKLLNIPENLIESCKKHVQSHV